MPTSITAIGERTLDNLIFSIETTIQEEATSSSYTTEAMTQIFGYPRYFISKQGGVFDTKEKKSIDAYINFTGTGTPYKKLYLRAQDGKAKLLLLHRLLALTFIPNPDKLPYVDHLGQNSLDNGLANLRWATASQNSRNQKVRAHSSKYMGVSYDKATGKWRASISEDGRSKYLTLCADEEDAARAYDQAARDMGFLHHNGFLRPKLSNMPPRPTP